jgi:uncharacterized protein
MTRYALRGYAAVFDSLSVPIGGVFREIICKGAFKKSLGVADIRFLWNHDSAQPLGRTTAGNLRLGEDAKGLWFELVLPDTSTAKDLWALVEKRIVSQMSFGFVVPAGGDRWKRASHDGLPIRELVTIDLQEISGTTFPAYPQTEIHVRPTGATEQPVRSMPSLDLKRRRLRLIELTAA